MSFASWSERSQTGGMAKSTPRTMPRRTMPRRTATTRHSSTGARTSIASEWRTVVGPGYQFPVAIEATERLLRSRSLPHG